MKLDLGKIKLVREEIPIMGDGGYNVTIPIPYVVTKLSENIRFSYWLAYEAFAEAVEYYFKDMQKYREENPDKAEWIDLHLKSDNPLKEEWLTMDFLVGTGFTKGIMLTDDAQRIVKQILRIPIWCPRMCVSQNLLLSLGLTTDTSLFANTQDCYGLDIGGLHTKIPKDKLQWYKIPDGEKDAYQYSSKNSDYYDCHGYNFTGHNIDTVPQALMLRDWAVCYVNLLWEEIAKVIGPFTLEDLKGGLNK